MQFVACTEERHASQILAIFNDAILNSTALYEYKPRTMETMATWFATKRSHGFPVIGLEDESGELVGFASYGSFRAFPANKYTVEHSVYIRNDQRGKGLGKQLLQAIVAAARAHDMHCVVGGIDVANATSIALHEKLGFEHAGTIKHAAFKFGRWLDLGFYQLLLDTPTHPVDG
ncbi:GNAT family N-acetyltransferase [Silvimonas sp. JCM 19000]